MADVRGRKPGVDGGGGEPYAKGVGGEKIGEVGSLGGHVPQVRLAPAGMHAGGVVEGSEVGRGVRGAGQGVGAG